MVKVDLQAVVQLHAAGDLERAEQGYRSVIAQNPSSDLPFVNLANICLRTGRYDEAAELLKSALARNSDNAATHLQMGVARYRQGDRAGGIECWWRAAAIDPLCAEAHLNLGLALAKEGDLDNSEACYRQAIRVKPDWAQAHHNLGNLFLAKNQREDAIACYRRALVLRPDYPEAYVNLGRALNSQPDEAITCYQKALQLRPDYPAASINLASTLTERGRLEEAMRVFQDVLKVHPEYPEAYNNLGTCLIAQGRWDEAASLFRHAITLRSNCAEAHRNLGVVLAKLGEIDEAIASYQECLRITTARMNPDSLVLTVGTLLNELERIPIIYETEAEIGQCREHYTSCLTQALDLVSHHHDVLDARSQGILREILFRITNFHLAYQQQNDRELQIAYADLATTILDSEIKAYLSPLPVRTGHGKIRLGIASECLKRHHGALWAYGWLSHLPKSDYEFFLYFLNGKADDLTQRFASLGTYRWLPFREHNYLSSLDVIKQDDLDVLLLPDVGMTSSSKILSLVRLAPVQCAAWGHPVTTGSSNIDYYLSGSLMETDESDSCYSEKLIRLPNIGLNLEPPPMPSEALTRSDFGIAADRIAYGAVQSLFKYLPQFDFIYPAIAKQAPAALFLFVESECKLSSDAFAERLRRAFEKEGLSFTEYVKILPRMKFLKFMQCLGVLDVILDSIGWNGGLTTMYSLCVNRPVVTLPGRFMRARHGFAMLKMIGVEELIADSLDEYIALSSRIGSDTAWRSSIINKISSQKHKLFNDLECVEYLDRFFKAALGR